MHDVFASLLGSVFTQLDQVIKVQNQKEGWAAVRDNDKSVQLTFEGVTFRHTSMRDKSGNCRHPFDEWLGLQKHQRHSS